MFLSTRWYERAGRRAVRAVLRSRAAVSGVLGIVALAALALALPATIAANPTCTETWTGGASDGLWQTAGNWSPANVPGSSDVVCVGSGATVKVTEGSEEVSSLEDQGTLAITGGSLELTDSSTMSGVDSLVLNGGTLTGAGSITVSGSFSLGGNSTMSGSGTTVVEGGVTGEVEASSGCEPMTLDERSLINEGTLTFTWGTLFMADGAKIENRGTFYDNSEAGCYGLQIGVLPESSGPDPSFVNTGAFAKTAEVGTATVGTTFGNEGSVEAQSGMLEFTGGGIPEEIALGSWSVAGEGTIVLAEGTFLIGEAVNLSAVNMTGATVTRAVSSGAPSGHLTPHAYASGTVTIAGSGKAKESGFAGATIESTPTGESEWESLCGPLTPSGGGAFSCSWNTASGPYPDGSYQLRAQLSDEAEPPASAPTAPITVLVDNTNPSGSVSATPEVTGINTVSGTGSDAGSGVASWQLQITPEGASEWTDACPAQSTPVSANTYRCTAELTEVANGPYELRAHITDRAGNSYTTAVVATTVNVSPPASTATPTISGTAQEGRTLSAASSWSGEKPITYAYQWQSCNSAGGECEYIEGATGISYTAADASGTSVRVRVTATNSAGSTASTSASTEIEPGAPVELQAPSVSGNASEGDALLADAGVWSGTEMQTGYQWERCDATGLECADLPGATDAEYALGEADGGSTLRVRVGVSNPRGSVTAVSSPTDIVGGTSSLTNTWAPSIAGIPQDGKTLTANAGSWLGVSEIGYAYQWQRCDLGGHGCEDIEGATDSTYTATAEDVGKTLRVVIGASEAGGSISQRSDASQPIAAEGAPVLEEPPLSSGTGLVGYQLSATTGTWSAEGPLTYSYQWEQCNPLGGGCATISGATDASYTLVGADLEKEIRVLVSAKDEGGTSVAASQPIGEIRQATLANVTAPSVSGSPTFGRALSADPGIWTADGSIAYTYRWERCDEHGEECSTIEGAEDPSYTPGEADVGQTVKVVVTTTGPEGSAEAASAVTPAIASEPIAPENAIAPSIEGEPVSGETLTALQGSWLSTEAISYTYQWQTCNEEGEECADIEGATSSTYLLAEGDVGLTIRVVLTATNSLGSAEATSTASDVVAAPGSPENTDRPTTEGTPQQAQRLVASNGSWSGSQPLSYYYQWERCNTSGESCVAIEEATKPSYTPTGGDVGSSIRIKVTATNSLGSAAAVSSHAIVAGSTEASTSAAIEMALETDPSVLAPATSESLEEQEVQPALTDSGESLSATTALASSSVSKETPGEFAVNTPAGELSFAPIGSAPNATKTPTIVNGAAAIFAETSRATDTINRADALGASTILQLRSPEAPTSFSWEVGLGPNQRLEKLTDGSVAVVEVSSASPLEGSLGEGLAAEPSEAEPEPEEEPGAPAEASDKELEEDVSEESPLERLPAAPATTTAAITPKSGELHPQETKAQYEAATSSLPAAEEQSAGAPLMVITPPSVLDAEGNTVAASLSIDGDTVTMTVSPSEGTSFPVTAQTAVAAPSDIASEAKTPTVRYGLSDPKAKSFSKSEEGGAEVSHFDTRLTSTPLHVKVARIVVPFTTRPTNTALVAWLKAVKTAGLEPYITVGNVKYCEHGLPCPEPSLASYRAGLSRLIRGLIVAHNSSPSTMPRVTIWGAWNEPDFKSLKKRDPLQVNAKRAALFWKIGRGILRDAGCHCTMVAGEFAEDDGYIAKYVKTVLRNHAYWPGKPHVWGFHDYHDLVHYYAHPHNSYGEAFARLLNRRAGSPRLWFSEQGVALEDGNATTPLATGSASERAKRQREAAKDFLRLRSVHWRKELSRVELVNYYLYRGPTKAEKEAAPPEVGPHLFDSALLPGDGQEPGDWRPAYCVLALGLNDGCPPSVVTQAAVPGTAVPTAGTIGLSVDPNELPASYFVEYGTSTSYGSMTTPAAVGNLTGAQSETVTLTGLTACTTYHYQAEAESSANEGSPSLGGDATFKTPCYLHAVSAASGGDFACAVLAGGGVKCWGDNEWGELGDGGESGAKSRGAVTVAGITNATAVTASERQDACALLSTGHVKCWGNNDVGQLGDGTTTPRNTPVEVSGITNAVAIESEGSNHCAVLAGGTVECWGIGSPYTPFPISGIEGVESLSLSGGDWGCVLGEGGMTCFGGYELDILGKGPFMPAPVPITALSGVAAIGVGAPQLCASLIGGEVYCWGNHFGGELGVGDGTTEPRPEPVVVSGITNATGLSVTGEKSCALLSSGGVKCWGNNELGGLGDGSEEGTTVPVSVSGITTATGITASPGWSCATLVDEKVECWGLTKLTPMPVYENE
jgi:hypothetical protein